MIPDAKRATLTFAGIIVGIGVAFLVLFATVGVTVLGVDIAYVIFGSLAAVAGAAALYGRLDEDQPSAEHRWTLLTVCLVSVVVVLVYVYLSSVGLVAMLTLFDDGERAHNFQTMDEVWPTEDVEASDDPWELERNERPLPESYNSPDGERRSTEAFFERSDTTGLVVLQDGQLVYESYDQGYDETSKATSWSVSKSHTSALVGIAHEEGHLDDLDYPAVEYAPELEGSGYEDVTVRQLLTMSSGVAFEESYDGLLSEINLLFARTYVLDRSLSDELSDIEAGEAPGEVREYRSTDTMALALVVEGATDRSLASYAEEALWQPTGMEYDAHWNTDPAGTTLATCCLNAAVRDYARFGQLYLDGGERDGQQVVPGAWVEESTTPQPPTNGGPSFEHWDYGYKWWLPEDSDHEYLAQGIYGQTIYVNERHEVVVAQTSVDDEWHQRHEERLAVLRSIAESLDDG